MAEIDKSLPNVRHEVKIPGAQAPTDVDITEEQQRQPVEVTPDEEGGATVNFEPGAVNQAQSNTHFDNLADILPETVLDPVGIQLRQNYTDYKMSRKDWESSYVNGLDLLGFKYDNRKNLFKEQVAQLTPYSLKQLHSFKHSLIKNYCRQMDPLEHKFLEYPILPKKLNHKELKIS